MGWNPRSWGDRRVEDPSNGAAQTDAASKLPPAPVIAASQAPDAAATQPPALAPNADGSPPRPPLPLTSIAKSPEEQFREFRAIMGLGLIIVCPILMALPPRRINMMTALQAGMFGWGVNEQTSWRTGHDVLSHYNRWVTGGNNIKKQ